LAGWAPAWHLEYSVKRTAAETGQEPLEKISSCDAVVIGAGPNGLAAAITLARVGRSVVVFEANDSIGGGIRSGELTLPGFTHDVCSAVYPLGVGSPFFRQFPLAQYGLEWIHPEVPLAHPMDDGTAVLLLRSLKSMEEHLGRDGPAYVKKMSPLVRNWAEIMEDVLAPIHLPRHPLLLSRFGWEAARPACWVAKSWFSEERGRALFAGLAAHSFLPLSALASSAFGIVLALLAHAVGWPVARGGSQRIADAMAASLRALGGEIVTGERVNTLEQLPPCRAVLCDVSPRQLLGIAGHRFSVPYRCRLSSFRHGPGAFKVDWALREPIPWKAADCARAGTVHLGGTLEEIAVSEAAVAGGRAPEKPFVLLAQQSLFDPTRAPQGRHVAWAYCHVPNGCTTDMTERIEAQVERFAPGFRDCILARAARAPAALEKGNANLVGGDISGGAQTVWQLLARPVLSWKPYATSARGIYLCSSSTPPGGGVHGMCGFHAARLALTQELL
jgi:phytoene dehydrogenase-like protein